jgi:hypothetical protein
VYVGKEQDFSSINDLSRDLRRCGVKDHRSRIAILNLQMNHPGVIPLELEQGVRLEMLELTTEA